MEINEKKYPYSDLKERTFEFSVSVILFLRDLPNGRETDVLKYQLTKAATSIGANYEESQAAQSPAEFRSKISIAVKEAREAHYWLRLIHRTQNQNSESCENLLKESAEIKAILGAIYSKTAKL